jgi:hypothetical protein
MRAREDRAGNVSPEVIDIPLVGLCAVLALVPAWLNYDIISKDGAFQYVPMARAFLAGSFRDTLLGNPQLPLFPLVMAGVAKLTGLSLELSGRVVSALGYVMAAMGMYAMSRLLFRGRAVALLASLFLAANAELMQCSVDCLKESLLLCLVIGGNCLAIAGVSAKGARGPLFLGSGACFAAGALVRSTALVFPGVWLALWVSRHGSGRWARAALLAAPLAGYLAAWVLFPGFTLFRKSCYHPGYFFASLHGLPDFFSTLRDVAVTFFTAGGPGVMMFAAYGLVRHERSFYRRHVLITLGVFFLILVFWIYASGRYYLVPVAWAYPMAAWGVVAALRSAGRAPRVLAVLAVVSCLGMWMHVSLTPPDPDRVAWREAGTWIRTELGPGTEIISNQERLVFYAQGKCLPLSAFRDAGTPGRVVAVDTGYAEGGTLDARMQALGHRPVRRFGRVAVYFPRA